MAGDRWGFKKRENSNCIPCISQHFWIMWVFFQEEKLEYQLHWFTRSSVLRDNIPGIATGTLHFGSHFQTPEQQLKWPSNNRRRLKSFSRQQLKILVMENFGEQFGVNCEEILFIMCTLVCKLVRTHKNVYQLLWESGQIKHVIRMTKIKDVTYSTKLLSCK